MKFPRTSLLFSAFLVQFLERFSYTIVLIQLPIYIAQKDVAKGLGWGQEAKGWIFFFWALIQNITPVFAGSIADIISQKKSLLLALLLVALGYFFLFFSKNFWIFLFSITLVGLGSGIFKPALQGFISKVPSKNKQIWALYILSTNIAFLLAGIFSKLIREVDWNLLFISSFIITLLNLFFVHFFIEKEYTDYNDKMKNQAGLDILCELKEILKKRTTILILGFTASFAIIYMQFYESLPNFIFDWSNTNSIARNLPSQLTMNTSQGLQISYEWIYNINPILIILFVTIVAKITSKYHLPNTLFLGLLLTILGFSFCGLTRDGYFLILGVIVYTFGEMVFNIKIYELISKIAPENKKSTYFGILNISFTIGLCIGAISGGYLYKELSEKHQLAIKFIHEHLHQKKVSIDEFLRQTGTTELLWNIYHPYIFWIPYILFGIIGLILLFYYKKYYNSKIVNNKGLYS